MRHIVLDCLGNIGNFFQSSVHHTEVHFEATVKQPRSLQQLTTLPVLQRSLAVHILSFLLLFLPAKMTATDRTPTNLGAQLLSPLSAAALLLQVLNKNSQRCRPRFGVNNHLFLSFVGGLVRFQNPLVRIFFLRFITFSGSMPLMTPFKDFTF